MEKTFINKQNIYSLLEGMPRSTPGMQLFDILMAALILLNVLAVIIGTVESIENTYGHWLFYFEVFSVTIFSIELLLRYWITSQNLNFKNQPSFWASPYNWIDIISILPFYLSLFITVDLRLLRLLRLIRIIRLIRYFRSMAILVSVIKQEAKPMLSALVMIIVLMLFSASGIYWLEKDIQPEAFGSLPAALWWVVVTLSTVGYGDVIPATALGKILGSVIMILGVGIVALPAGMLASRFTDTIHRQQGEFKNRVQQSLLSAEDHMPDRNIIEYHRQELFISKSEAQVIIGNCLNEYSKPINFCPNCGEKLSALKRD